LAFLVKGILWPTYHIVDLVDLVLDELHDQAVGEPLPPLGEHIVDDEDVRVAEELGRVDVVAHAEQRLVPRVCRHEQPPDTPRHVQHIQIDHDQVKVVGQRLHGYKVEGAIGQLCWCVVPFDADLALQLWQHTIACTTAVV
jgi:hypothetical protein